ncbi:uncharacterized protein [Primulina eburnea]|uniref:uncharacterized protein n=1 Tax=Primulina eburnea TaxID=1245227 RepID=UPI003C6C837E
MLLSGATTRCSMILFTKARQTQNPISPAHKRATIAAAATAALLLSGAIGDETLSNVPQTLSSECVLEQQDCKKSVRIQRPRSRKAETCTIKCVGTCIQGGFGSPGEGPLNIRRPLVVFKDGFRSRKYCLGECSDICNLIGDGDDGP